MGAFFALCPRVFPTPTVTHTSHTAHALPLVLGYELYQVIRGNFVALLFEERRESRLSVQRPVVVLKHRPMSDTQRRVKRLDPVEINMANALKKYMFRQLRGTDLTDQANGIRYFPSLLQNCLLAFNIF